MQDKTDAEIAFNSVSKFFDPWIDGKQDKRDRVIEHFAKCFSPYKLAKFVNEFAVAFNVNFAMSSPEYTVSHGFLMCSPNALPAGKIWMEYYSADEEVYNYNSELVKKQGGAISEKYTRSSRKLSVLLKTITRNKEFPTDARLSGKYLKEAALCFNYALKEERPTAISVPNHALEGLIRFIVEQHPLPYDVVESIQNAHKVMLANEEATAKCKSLRDRYLDGGCWAIGVRCNEDETKTVGDTYYVAELGRDKDTGITGYRNGLFRRVHSLEDIEPVHLALTFAKPMFEDRNSLWRHSSYGIPRMDRYYEELDIGTGFQSAEILWVFIPKISDTV